MFKNFSIIIPIFNEEENIENLIFEIINNITKEEKINFEIIVVNDSSTDKSLEILEEISKKIEIIVVNNDKNVGQSYSILNGVLSSKFDTIVTLDGDGQNDPKDMFASNLFPFLDCTTPVGDRNFIEYCSLAYC